MAPRAKSKKATPKPAGCENQSRTGGVDLQTSAGPSSRAERLRGRATGNDGVTKATRKTKQNGDRPIEPSTRRALSKDNNSHSQSIGKEISTAVHDDESTELEQHQPKSRGRPKRTPRHELEVLLKSSVDKDVKTKTLAKVDEIPETQLVDPMEVDTEIQEKALSNAARTFEGSDGLDGLNSKDGMNVASLRRCLSDLTRRYESLQARHGDLQEIGIKAAELNFKRLRKQAEENAEASNKLISQLREEIVAQSTIVDQVEILRQQLELSQTEATDLRAMVTNTNNALSDAKCEIKSMSAKLAASRTTETNMKMPTNNSSKATAVGNRAFQESLQVAQAKEDLYGDLTGLIVRDIKRGAKEDVFDCIQTGRNGSLHFKLALEKDDGNDYEGVQFTYRPQLDANRDSEVIDMLPDYLTEEITFPRAHASKFYTRVTKALTDRTD